MTKSTGLDFNFDDFESNISKKLENVKEVGHLNNIIEEIVGKNDNFDLGFNDDDDNESLLDGLD